MPQVIIVSNRLPVSVKKENGQLVFSPSVGGLATGLSSYVSGRKNTWIGWPGIASDELTNDDKQSIITNLAEHNCNPVFLSKRQIDDFYNGYSNAILWPLFHNLPFKDKDTPQHKRWWQAYRSVNKLFADAVLNEAQPRSQVWVHDYQLMLLPDILRRELSTANIGFFLHIPFPAAKHFSKLAEYKKLLQGIVGAGLIGFHTPSYVEHFLETCAAANLGVIGTNQLILPNRAIRVADFPMGIDYEKYAAASKSKAVKAAVKRYQKKYRGKKVIVAVDRMDPSKGLVERLKAYRMLLEQTPALLGKVVFSMIAAPSRSEIEAYKNLARRLDTLVAEINTRFGSSKWQPVDYINVSQPFEEVAALFQVADVAFIAPLRDGMNLAAKEFVASNHKKGVLVLSETAGAAEELQDALIVNPRKPATLVAGLQDALTMPKRELQNRLSNMQQHLSSHNVQTWAKSFVDTLQQPIPGTPEIRTKQLKGTSAALLRHDYRQSQKRLLLLDYDGSLVRFSENYKDARPPKSLLEILDKLSNDAHNEVVVVSGRSGSDLENWLGHLPISLVAEHGAAVRRAGSLRWKTLEHAETKWRKAILPILDGYTTKTPGAKLETKLHSLVWHYRASPPYYAQKYAVTIKKVLKKPLKTHGLQLFQGNKVLEIKDPRISKDVAIEHWLKRPHDFVLIIGDDFTDEDMFRVAPETAYTVKVGRGRTAAHYRLHSASEVKKLLQSITK